MKECISPKVLLTFVSSVCSRRMDLSKAEQTVVRGDLSWPEKILHRFRCNFIEDRSKFGCYMTSSLAFTDALESSRLNVLILFKIPQHLAWTVSFCSIYLIRHER